MGILPREANYVGQNQSVQMTPNQRRRIVHKSGLGSTNTPQPLLSQQFAPMSQIMSAHAVDTRGTVGANLMPAKHAEVHMGVGDTDDYPTLQEDMKQGGPTTIPPVHFGTSGDMFRDYGATHLLNYEQNSKALGNGGHRTAIAQDLGWKAMPVTKDMNSSGYEEYREPMYNGTNTEVWRAEGEGFTNGSSSSGGYNDVSDHSSEWRDSSGSSSDSGPSEYPRSLNPGDRSFVPMQDSYGNDVGGRDPGARWHAAGQLAGKTPGKGLYSQLHPAQAAAGAPLTLNNQQFSNSKQDVLPGMNHYGAQYGSHEWSAGNA